MLESNNNLRAVILYRVSTDRQDESLQVNICQGFCKNHNMDIVEEYREIDVSGFKTPLAKRYELLKILNRAEIKKDFDVLVVYLHDRLGRREDETPQVVQNLFKNGVRCFDAHNNSEIKVETHTDKLMNYMSSWTSELESIKTSARVKDAMSTKNSMTKQYMGGTAPFGYVVRRTDQINYKGKVISKLVIDEDESEVIKKIFELCTINNYGSIRIAQFLNESGYENRKKTAIDKETGEREFKKVIFRSNSINRVLKNTVYIGRKFYNCSEAERDRLINIERKNWKQRPYDDELRIISDDVFYQANEMSSFRKTIKNAHVETSTKGGTLCSGIAYCKCGGKLKSDYSIKTYIKKNGDKTLTKTYRYTCMEGSNDRKTHLEKHNTSVYFSAKKYDDLVRSIVMEEINKMDDYDSSEYIYESMNKELKILNKKIIEKNINLKNVNKAIIKFEQFIDDAVENDNDDISVYISGISRNKKKIVEIKNEIKLIQDEIKKINEKKTNVKGKKNILINFKERFNNADLSTQKSLLSKLVKRVIFDNDKIDIVFKI